MTVDTLSSVAFAIARHLIESHSPEDALAGTLERLEQAGVLAAYLHVRDDSLYWSHTPDHFCPAALDMIRKTGHAASLSLMPVDLRRLPFLLDPLSAGHAVFFIADDERLQSGCSPADLPSSEKLMTNLRMHRLIAAPVWREGRLLGMLLLWGESLGSEHTSWAEQVGELVAAAITRPATAPGWQLPAGERKELQILQAILSALAIDQPLAQTLMTIQEAISRVVPDLLPPLLALRSWARDAWMLEPPLPEWVEPFAAELQGEARRISLPVGRSKSWAVTQHGEPYITEDIADLVPEFPDPDRLRQYQTALGIQSLAVFPMMIERQPVGAMLVGCQHGEPSQRQIEFLRVSAAQIAVVLNNAHEFERQRQRLERLQRLSAVAEEILLPRSSVQRDQAILHQAMRLLDADAAALFGFRAGGGIACLAHQGVMQRYVRAVCENYTQLPVQKVSQTLLPVRIDDMTTDPRVAPVRLGVLEEKIQTALSLPLIVRGLRKGILTLYRRRAIPFSDEEVLVGQAFASLAALSHENLRLIQDSERQFLEAEAMRQVLQELSGCLDEDTIAAVILENAVRLTGSDGGGFFLWRADQQALVPVNARYCGEVISANPIEPGKGAAGLAFSEDRPVVVHDYFAWEGRLPGYRRQSAGPVAAIPIREGGEPIGSLVVFRDVPGPVYSDEDADFLEALAEQAGLAIVSARLAEERDEARDVTMRLLDAVPAILVILDPQDRIVHVNRGFLQRTGWTREELIGQDYVEMCIPRGRAGRLRERLVQIRDGTGGHAGFNPILTKDGGEIPIHWHSTAVRDDEGRAIFVLGSGHPASENPAAE